MEFGVYSFGDLTKDENGILSSPSQRLQELMEEINLADQVGLNVYGLGEHHRPEYTISSPSTVLAAASQRTKNIRLSSAVTVLSSEDPVRVYQQFSTVDLLSGGRAEIMAGRGSFIESYPLFGYDLKNYDELFSEKLEMLLELNRSEVLNWKGQLTQTVSNRGVYPRPLNNKLPIWIAVGGTPESIVRAAQKGLPLALAIIGGMPARYAPLIKLYKDVYAKSNHVEPPQTSINSFMYIADSSQKARDEFFPGYAYSMNRIGKDRGWGPVTRQDFEAVAGSQGSLIIGSVNEVVDKILYEKEIFGHTRFMGQMDLGMQNHKGLMRSIELYAEVVEKVEKETRYKVQGTSTS